MADNTTLNTGSGGNVIRTLEDGSSVQWPVGVVAYATTVGTPDVLTIPVAAALADATSNPTTLLTGCCIELFNGTSWDRVRGDTTNGLDVDVTRVIPGTSATHLGKAEDAAHASGDTGVMALSVRQDTAAALAGTDADYQPLITDASGRLHVNVGNTVTVGSHAVTNAGTFAVQADSTVTDDAAYTAASGKGVPMMGFATSDSVDSGDVGAVAMLTNRQLKVSLYDSSGAEIVLVSGYQEDAATPATIAGGAVMMERDDALSTLTPIEGDWAATRCSANGALWVAVDGTVTVGTHAVTQSGTWTVQPGNTANTTAWLVTGTGGTFPVTDSGGSLTVDNGGTFAVQATVAASATNIAKAEDVASADADVGVPAMAVRKATPANTSGTDGDYEMLQMSAGRLWASATIDAALPTGSNVIGAVTQSGTWNVGTVTTVTTCSTVTTVSAITGGGTAHDGAAGSINPLLMGAYASAAAPTDVSADADAVRVWALRSGAVATQPTYAGILAVAGNGASGTGVQRVTIANDSTGILAGVTTVTTVTTCSTLTTLTGGGVAHDGVDSGNPVKVGAKATTSQLGLTPVANLDRSDLITASDGALLVRDGSLEDCISERVTNTDGASTAMTGAFAATASQRIYLTDITISNSSATFCTVDIRDGAAGSVLWTFPVPATGGVTHRFTRPLRFTANTALAYDASAATTTLTISVSGFKSKT